MVFFQTDWPQVRKVGFYLVVKVHTEALLKGIVRHFGNVLYGGELDKKIDTALIFIC